MKPTRKSFLNSMLFGLGYLLLLLMVPFRVGSRAAKNPGGERQPDDRGRSMKKTVPAGKEVVSIRKCGSYNAEETFRAVKEGLEAIGFRIKTGSSVLLKPNIIGQNTPDQCTTTHPSVVEAVCRIFKESGCSVTIGDSSAFYQGGGTREGLRTSGMSAVARRYGAALLPFEATYLVKVESGRALTPFYMTRAVKDFDLVVNMPKMKIHRLARYTGAVKNVYGCIPGGTKQNYHKIFDHRPDYREYWGRILVDVYEAVSPGLNIMDAVYGLDNDGPAATGDPRFTGVILVSENGAALDTVACRIMGFDPRWVPAVREALDRGLCCAPEKIKVEGELLSVPYVKLPDPEPLKGLRLKLDDYIFDQFIMEPRIDRGKCRQCGSCIDGCAVGAIKRDRKGYPVIDPEKCINCYCCQEYCPNGAVYLHGGVVNHFMRAARYLLGL